MKKVFGILVIVLLSVLYGQRAEAGNTSFATVTAHASSLEDKVGFSFFPGDSISNMQLMTSTDSVFVQLVNPSTGATVYNQAFNWTASQITSADVAGVGSTHRKGYYWRETVVNILGATPKPGTYNGFVLCVWYTGGARLDNFFPVSIVYEPTIFNVDPRLLGTPGEYYPQDVNRDYRFISTSGNNSNNGTSWADAWADLTKLAGLTKPTTVYLAPDSFVNVKCTINTEGVRLIGYGGGRTILTGAGGQDVDNDVITVFKRDCWIKGIKFYSCSAANAAYYMRERDPLLWPNAITLQGDADYAMIFENEFDSLNYKSVVTQDSAYNSDPTGGNGRKYFSFVKPNKRQPRFCQYFDNMFYRVLFIAIDINGYAPKVYGNTIRGIRQDVGYGGGGIQFYANTYDGLIYNNIIDSVPKYYMFQLDHRNMAYENILGTCWDQDAGMTTSGSKGLTIFEPSFNSYVRSWTLGGLIPGTFEGGREGGGFVKGWTNIDSSGNPGSAMNPPRTFDHRIHSFYAHSGKSSYYMKAPDNSGTWLRVNSDTLWMGLGTYTLRGYFWIASGNSIIAQIRRTNGTKDSVLTLNGVSSGTWQPFSLSFYNNTVPSKAVVSFYVASTGAQNDGFIDDVWFGSDATTIDNDSTLTDYLRILVSTGVNMSIKLDSLYVMSGYGSDAYARTVYGANYDILQVGRRIGGSNGTIVYWKTVTYWHTGNRGARAYPDSVTTAIY